MKGMNATTGAALDGDEHLEQSIADILTTPIGSRVMLREYGSDIPALIDQPMNAVTRQKVYAATATALARWEPRIRLTRVTLDAGDVAGSYRLTLEYRRVDAAGAASGGDRLVLPLFSRLAA